MTQSGALGKKVFFLNPPPVLNEVVEELARREFEVYLVRDHVKLLRLLKKEPDSIVFINIDEGSTVATWEGFVSDIQTDEATKDVGIGIISMESDKELMERFLMDLQVGCGYVVVKIGAASTTEILIKTLEANEARGRRKFVRATCPPGLAQAIIDSDGRQLRAELADISCAGAAMKFTDKVSFPIGAVLKRLQISVKGTNVVMDGFVAARRGDDGDNPAHIVMFAPASLDDVKRDKIRTIVSRINQSAMDRTIASV